MQMDLTSQKTYKVNLNYSRPWYAPRLPYVWVVLGYKFMASTDRQSVSGEYREDSQWLSFIFCSLWYSVATQR